MNLLHNVPAGGSRKFLLRFSNLNPVEGMEAFGGDIRASATATWYPRDRHMVCYVNTCSLEDRPKGSFCDVKGVLTSPKRPSLVRGAYPHILPDASGLLCRAHVNLLHEWSGNNQ